MKLLVHYDSLVNIYFRWYKKVTDNLWIYRVT